MTHRSRVRDLSVIRRIPGRVFPRILPSVQLFRINLFTPCQNSEWLTTLCLRSLKHEEEVTAVMDRAGERSCRLPHAGGSSCRHS
jgi:hypothetical protein